MKTISKIILIGLIGGLILLGGWLKDKSEPIGNSIPKHLKLKAPKEKIFNYRIVKQKIPRVSFGNTGSSTPVYSPPIYDEIDIVIYDYISENRVEGKFLWENDNDKFTNTKILKEEGNERTVAIYGVDNFYRDDTGVFEVEYGATTTLEIFFGQTGLEPVLGALQTNTQQAIANPTITLGSISTGSYSDTLASDDSRLVLDDSGGSPSNKYRLDFNWDGVSPADQFNDFSGLNLAGVNKIEIDLEAKDVLSTDDYYAMFWNFKTSSWNEVGAAMSIGTTESSFNRSISSGATYDAKDYLNSGGEIKIRIANAKALGKPSYPDNDGQLAIDYLVITVTNDTDTFYPSPDGTFNLNSGTSNWTTAVNAAESTSVNQTQGVLYVQEYQSSNWQINRIGMIFDTSIIGSGPTITEATLYLYKDNSLYNNTQPETLDIVSFAPANDTTWVVGDFDSFGTTVYGSLVYASFTGSQLDAVTISDFTGISKTGSTKFGLRGHRDVSVTTPTGDAYITFFATEETGTAKDPYLSVTYSEAAATVTSIESDLIIFE